ncbi:phosphoribosyltransferase-like protein [Aidingimonas lacisalsi]|uniref:phosphoribosyltransferase-like protein n=1 Tax=Aidingimonas lacisalsi TaxID=2604086 RepID=UPI0011D273D2|nr:hypothetical protein [Aidingimonas lacisalsi]
MNYYKDYLDQVEEYLVKMKKNARLLIEENIWDSVRYEDVELWLQNFSGDEEKLLAGLLLDNLVFRSAEQTSSLLNSAIDCSLSHAIYNNPLDVLRGEDYKNILTSRYGNPDIKVVPVIRDLDPPTKSGPAIARLYKRHVGLAEEHMIWPWLVEKEYAKGVRTFVFIDDTLATGNQFSEFLEKYANLGILDATLIYIPLLAHREGLEKINREYPKVIISPVETVDEKDSFFELGNASMFDDLENLYLVVAEKYLNRRLFKIMCKGYKGLALTFSYNHSTPNSTLPLYWYEDEHFKPLLRR